jgi:DNA-directed RNA polymerase specialized sigma24 family protein
VIELTDFRDPLDECERDSMRGAVRRVVNGLPGHYARILELRFGDELSGHEIARTLQMSEDAAESLLSRARQAFKVAWTASLDGSGAAFPDGGDAS